jgi:hypothetical protein
MGSLNGRSFDQPHWVATSILGNTPTGTTDLFNVAGPIEIVEIMGFILLTPMQAQETLLKITGQVAGLNVVDMCVAKDATGWVTGTVMHITGIMTDALDEHEDGIGSNGASPVLFISPTTGVISLNNASAANDGQTSWLMKYNARPGSTVTAAF